ncbi:hypothetical protein O4N82_24435 [Vibrio parahaemolyticus]|uniref:ASCH domain-containing protein n=1 Tax=Vibrio parahaemolyticus TaxID=670 RepID=UPI0022B4EDD2|nr:ASCH domain-containing protein [Vibrio parahaemolyticus]MCZ6404845.1 hypothetical protein [Vibrio parahaemolyticus]
MKVLLSIRPEYVKQIFDGSKKYEFRRKSFKKKVNTILVYSTSPTKKVVGEISFDNIISDTPEAIWDRCKSHAGISKIDFFNYYSGTEQAFAIEIKCFSEYERPICLDEIRAGLRAPQYFIYLE